MNPDVFTCYNSPLEKRRIGHDNDGGYIIAMIPNINYDLMISAGLYQMPVFEERFSQLYPKTPCNLYDGNINGIQTLNFNLLFHKQHVGFLENKFYTNLHKSLEINKKVFIKLDINGEEINWINSLSKTHLDHIAQIVIQYHNPFYHIEHYVIDKLNESHALIHIHPNNKYGARHYWGRVVPNVLECTYVNKKYLPEDLDLNTNPIPSPIDKPNDPDIDEIELFHPPFVN
jgi:hypothetical protein